MSLIFLCLFTALFLFPLWLFIPSFAGVPYQIVIGLIALAMYYLQNNGHIIEKGKYNYFFLGLLVACSISPILGSGFYGYFEGATNAFLEIFKALILTYLIMGVLNDEKRLNIYVNFFLFLVVLIAINGIHQAWYGADIFGIEPILDNILTPGGSSISVLRIRSEGTLSGPNDICSIFVIAVPFFLTKFLRGRNFIIKPISFVCLSILGYAIYLTRSRGGFLSAVVVCFWYFYNLFKHHIRSKAIRFSIGLLFALFIFVVGSSFVGREISAKDASASTRVDIWAQGIELLKQNPLFGVGYGRFGDMIRHDRSAHSSFVRNFAETGFVGHFFYIGILYLVFRNYLLFNKNSLAKSETSLNFQHTADDVRVSLIGYLSAGIFLERTYNLLYFILIGLSFAIFIIVKRIGIDNLDFDITKKDIRNVAILVGLSILTIHLFVKTASHM